MAGVFRHHRDVPRVAFRDVQFRSRRHRVSVRGRGRLDHGVQIPPGRRRDFDPVRDAHDLYDAAGDRGQLGRKGPGQGIHDRLSDAGNADAWRVHGAGSGAVLPVLRGGADPDVPDHRHLGRGQPHLRQLQVLSLYLPRFGADAGGDGGHVRGCGHHLHRGLRTGRGVAAQPIRSGPRRSACWASRSSAARRR